MQTLEDRELSFVYPMLRIESALFEKINAGWVDNEVLSSWIKDSRNVSESVVASSEFIHSLVTCVVRNAAENSGVLCLDGLCEIAAQSGEIIIMGGSNNNNDALNVVDVNVKMDKVCVLLNYLFIFINFVFVCLFV